MAVRTVRVGQAFDLDFVLRTWLQWMIPFAWYGQVPASILTSVLQHLCGYILIDVADLAFVQRMVHLHLTQTLVRLELSYVCCASP